MRLTNLLDFLPSGLLLARRGNMEAAGETEILLTDNKETRSFKAEDSMNTDGTLRRSNLQQQRTGYKTGNGREESVLPSCSNT